MKGVGNTLGIESKEIFEGERFGGVNNTLHFHLSEPERGEEIKGRMKKKKNIHKARELSDNVCVSLPENVLLLVLVQENITGDDKQTTKAQ